MKNLSENMREVKVLLDDLFREIKPVIDGSLPKEKEEQLKALEKAYGHYLNAGKPVPKEFQDIKNRFQHEMELMALARKEYPAFFNFLQEKLKEIPLEALAEPVMMTQRELMDKASRDPGFLPQMLKLGEIKPGTIIERTYQNIKYEGTIENDGKFHLVIDGTEKQFEDVHAAAAFVAGREVNGLDFWRIKNPKSNSLVRLAVFFK